MRGDPALVLQVAAVYVYVRIYHAYVGTFSTFTLRAWAHPLL